MSNSKFKKLQDKRNIAINQVIETHEAAHNAKSNDQTQLIFKSMYEDLEDCRTRFYSNHNQIVGALEEFILDFNEQDAIRKRFDKLYYESKGIYYDIFREVSSPPNYVTPRSSSRSFPQPKLPTFDGNFKNWQHWHDLYKVMIHENNDLSEIEKYQQLRSAVLNEALSLVKTIPLAANNYHIAYDALVKRYQNKRVIATTALNAIIAISIKTSSGKELRSMLDTFSENLSILSELGFPTKEWDFLVFNMMLTKLEVKLRTEFELFYSREKKSEIPSYDDLFSFIENHCIALESVQQMPSSNKSTPSSSKPVHTRYNSTNFSNFHQQSTSKVPQTSSFNTIVPVCQTRNQSNKSNVKCHICSSNHTLSKCPIFQTKTAQERINYVRGINLCENCLHFSHKTEKCSSSYNCWTCGLRHHSLLCQNPRQNPITVESTNSNSGSQENPANPPISNRPEESVTTCHTTISKNSVFLLSTVVADILDSRGNFQPIRILLDSASEANFISEKCLSRLGLAREQFSISVQGLNHMASSSTKGKTHCLIRPQGQTEPTFEFEALVLPQLCANIPSLSIDSSKWDHIRNIKLSDSNFHTPSQIDILVGCELFPQILKNGVIHGDKGQASAFNTVFGYVLIGKVDNSTRPTPDTVSSCYTSVEPPLEVCLEKFWEIEQVPHKMHRSPEDIICDKIFSETVFRQDSGRFVVSLPFINSEPNLGDTYPIALKRFKIQEARLLRNPVHYEAYKDFIKDYLNLGHMIPVPTLPSNEIRDSSYFIPHHSVFNSDKIRVVFDGSQKGPKGLSLNQTLFSGPKLQNDVRGILLNFRTHAVAFITDIVKMFRQILVTPEHTRYQNILWRFSEEDPIQTYSLRTVVYGLKSSPYLAIRTIQELAKIESKRFPNASRVLLKDIYVDDILTGHNSVASAIHLQQELISLLSLGGFELRKWASNNLALISSFPDSDTQMSISFDKTEPNFIKVLGLQWNPITDSFTYLVKPADTPCTKRGILSQIMKIFDPLGFCAPVCLLAKHLMQELWKIKIEWDTIPSPRIVDVWNIFRTELPELSKLNIPRRLTVDQPSRIELHGFSDASMIGYAATVYLRIESVSGEIFTQLVMAKSKVAPVKTLSLPRLELLGAHLLCDLISFIQSSYAESIIFNQIWTWCDSQVVLRWLSDSPHRWQTFVANRVCHIQETLPGHIWHYVPSRENPADCASRGLTPNQLVNHEMWWQGPSFLRSPREDWSNGFLCPDFCENDVVCEERKSFVTVTLEQNVIDAFLAKYSSLEKILRILSYMFRLTSKTQFPALSITQQELHNSMIVIVRHVQRSVFSDIISRIESTKLLPKPFRKLSLFLDTHGCLRVGGRIRHSELSYSAKHPLLLPRSHRLTSIIIESTHAKYFHPGLKTLHYLLRQQFWILSARYAIQKVVSQCILCFRLHPKTAVQLMGDLPPQRISQLKAFSNVAVDYCGPFEITMGRYRNAKKSKAYILVIVCSATKAVHLELSSDLSTDTFLAAFKRFVSRRGRVSHIYCDNGTAFVGAERLLRQYSKQACDSLKIIWHFCSPGAPHLNGLAEAGVKSTKAHLKRVIGEQRLTYEELATFLCQVEALLNSRPLYAQSIDPNDLLPLTPGHFLTLEPLNSVPEPEFSELKLNTLSRWQLIQRLQSEFWKKWHLEYLNTLQQRTKWTESLNNIQLNSLVIIKNEQKPPMQWVLGRVTELHPGADGLIRVVTVKTATGTYRRPVVKLCPLPIADA